MRSGSAKSRGYRGDFPIAAEYPSIRQCAATRRLRHAAGGAAWTAQSCRNAGIRHTLAEIGVGNDLATATARLQEAIGNLDLKQHFDDVVPQNATEIAKMVLAVTQDRSRPEASDTDPQV